jgi:hypothetical protein
MGSTNRHRSAQPVAEIRLSDIFDFPRKSFTLFHFTDRLSRLALALDTLSWRVSGTIVGTVLSSRSVDGLTDLVGAGIAIAGALVIIGFASRAR